MTRTLNRTANQTGGLFPELPPALPVGTLLLPGALGPERQLQALRAVEEIAAAAPFAKARTRAGYTSAAMTNCGAAGWWSDLKGYRYERTQPGNGMPWPALPDVFLEIVREAVKSSPWPDFTPDACLINFYAAGARMGLHQDRDERDFTQPIVTVSLGDSADFLIGSLKRTGPAEMVVLRSGDILIMGGDSRMRFHGIRKTYPGTSPLSGLSGRYSLTFRRAL